MSEPTETTESTQLPPRIALAWGLRERGSRGPKPGLSLERIVAAGIEVADADGLVAVSMARVAKQLGAGTMSLYRYVGGKDDLVALMVDGAMAEPPDLGAPGQTWSNGLRRWALSLRERYGSHRWALEVPISSILFGPNNARWLEQALRALASTPLSEQHKLSTVLLVSGFVRNEATLMADFESTAETQKALQGYGATLARLIDAETFPALARAIASGALEDEDAPDAEFEFGLTRILHGIEALIRAY